MGLESTVVCIDNSESMRNGDFVPTRLHAEQEAVRLICQSKTRCNPENNVGLLTLANPEVVSTLTTDVGRLLSKLHQIQPNGTINFLTGIRIAHLVLKHRQGKSHKMRIVIFVGSPVDAEEEDLLKLANRLKKEKVNMDIINFAEDVSFSSNGTTTNSEKLAAFIDTINGKEGTGSHLVTIPQGPNLSYALLTSPVIQDNGSGAIGLGGAEFEFGIDSNEILAMALRISMEEQRQRHEVETRKSDSHPSTQKPTKEPTPSAQQESSEEALLEKDFAMSLDNDIVANSAMHDFSTMSEDDQLAYAMRISLQQQSEGCTNSSSKKEPMETDSTEKKEDYSEVMNDPEFVESVLQDLPGVNPQSESFREAMGNIKKGRAKDKSKKNKEDKKKK